jgi:hypothetical protein
MSTTDTPPVDLFLLYAKKLDALGFPYMVTGSVAGMLYGEPRITHDVDIVVALAPSGVRALAAAFPLEEFYCPPEEVLLEESLRPQRGHFNLIHHETGFKADIYVASRDPLHRWALAERRCVEIDDVKPWIAPPEYVIVRKLEYFREGGSEKHLRDIAAILRVSGESVRHDVVEDFSERLGLTQEWQRAQSLA